MVWAAVMAHQAVLACRAGRRVGFHAGVAPGRGTELAGVGTTVVSNECVLDAPDRTISYRRAYVLPGLCSLFG